MNQKISLAVNTPRTMKSICTTTRRALFVFTERSTFEDRLVAEYFHKEQGYQVARTDMSKEELKLVVNKMSSSEGARVGVLNELFKNNLITTEAHRFQN